MCPHGCGADGDPKVDKLGNDLIEGLKDIEFVKKETHYEGHWENRDEHFYWYGCCSDFGISTFWKCGINEDNYYYFKNDRFDKVIVTTILDVKIALDGLVQDIEDHWSISKEEITKSIRESKKILEDPKYFEIDRKNHIESEKIFLERSNELLQKYENKYIFRRSICAPLEKQFEKTYFEIFDHCFANHNWEGALYFKGLWFFDKGDYFSAFQNISKYIQKSPSEEKPISERYTLGVLQNLLGKYNEAIVTLSSIIEQNPANQKAYFERALSYFETGNFDQSLSDYIKSKKQPRFSNRHINFSAGLIQGITLGANHSLEDFVPSMLCSLQGLSNGIWAFALDPKEVSVDMISSCKEAINIIRNSGAFDTLKAAIPELKELSESWHEITEFRKGELIGNVIGKHGTDLVVLAGVGKGVKVFGELRKANAVLTLDTMKSLEKRKVLKDISKQWKEKTAKELEAIKSGKLRIDKELKKKYKNQNLSEQQVRKILHENGATTFPRLEGIPKEFVVQIADSGYGMLYTSPKNNHFRIRVMPGNPDSPFPAQRKPYVVHSTPAGRLDKNGKIVLKDSVESHIPLEEYDLERILEAYHHDW